MSELKIFENSEFGRVRVVIREGEPWLVASDICRCLDLSNVGQMLVRIAELLSLVRSNPNILSKHRK